MANRVWKGGAGDWSDPSRWTTTGTAVPGAPIPGDSATLASGDATVFGAEGLGGSIFNGVSLTLGDTGDDFAALDLSDAFLSDFFSIKAAGSATIAAQGACAIACGITDDVSGSVFTLDGATSDPNGLILAVGQSTNIGSGATLKLQGVITDENAAGVNALGAVENDSAIKVIAGSGFNVTGALTGTGTIDVSDAASVRLYGSVSSGQVITFGDVDGRLQVADPGGFQGAITGFASGDLIDLSTVDAAAASYDAATRTLTLTDGSGATVATLGHVQAAPGALTVTADPGGTGTTVGYAGALPRRKYQIADADRAMGSDVVRATATVPGTATPITGAGVKVGIISTSFDVGGLANQDAAAGYLPANPDGTSAVHVLQEGAAGNDDEGRAMAELVHQVAPGAQIYFAAGGSSQGQYESAVAALTRAGCDVIADDITYFATPFYQVTGGLDDVVSTAVAGGVNFFTSAGNFGQSYLEAPFKPRTTTLAGVTGTQQAEIFSNGTPYERITVPANYASRIDLQSTAPYEGVNGAGAPYALTLKIYDATGNPIQYGTAYPVSEDGTSTTDLYYNLPTSTSATDYQVAVYLNGNQVSPADFKLILSANGSGTGPGGVIDDPLAGQGSGDERGQQLIPGVNTVGASDFANSAAFGGAPSYDEYFSDQGPGTLLYDGAGHPLPSPQSAGKVDFDAPDEIDTTVPGFSPFGGTSAATPNAAAVAALMLQANPNLTTAQVTAFLKQSAIGQGLPASQQGAGLIQATRAVALSIAALPPTIAGTVPVQTTRSEAPVHPFGTVTLTDANGAATDVLTITPTGSGGVLADGLGFSGLRQVGGAYVLSGTAGGITSELQSLVYTPAAGQPNTSSTTAFTLSDANSAGQTASAGPVSVVDIDPAVSPSITGTHVVGDTAEQPVLPFAGVAVADSNASPTDSLAITLAGSGGSLTGDGLSGTGTGYSLAAADPATLTDELDALSFTPAAGTPGVANSTTFTIVDLSSAGTSAADSDTVVIDRAVTAPAPTPVPRPTPIPTPTPPPVTSPDAVSISPTVSFKDGIFTITGAVSSASGVRSVEITAEVDGVATDLGAATVDAGGTFSFSDRIGPHAQAFLGATVTDDAGGTSTGADPLFSLQGGQPGVRAEQDTYDADGSAVLVLTRFGFDGRRDIDVEAPGQTVDLQPRDIVFGHHRAGTSFVFNRGDGLDVVDGFKVGGTGHDTMALPSSDFRNFADVLRDTGDVNGSAFITDPKTGDAIRLAGVSTAELKPRDFTFVT